MKTKFTFLFLLIFVSTYTFSQITSISNGNWSNPSTWGGIPPTPGSNVIINHTVTLDMDYGYSTGSITINNSGVLVGNSSMRALALYGGTLTITGDLNIPRVALFSGTITNGGMIQSDSLFVQASLNNSSGTIQATQFMISTGGVFTNTGIVFSSNFLNVQTVSNSGHINSNDFMNSKQFTNEASGVINVNSNFLNSDSLANPAVFQNDGSINVVNDWMNTDTIKGSGKFCIGHNSTNKGVMIGTFDFCDQTGGDVDLNLGTIAPSVTTCVNTCSVSINEKRNDVLINISPNPSNGIFNIDFFDNSYENISIFVFNSMGDLILRDNIGGQKSTIDLSKYSKGVYFVKIQCNKKTLIQKIVIQ